MPPKYDSVGCTRMKTISNALAIFLILSSSYAWSDVLLIEGIDKEPPNTLEGVPRPNPGMTAERVEQVFGTPQAKSDPVGNPPIVRWVYSQFVVVFENDRVINSVIQKPQYTDLNK